MNVLTLAIATPQRASVADVAVFVVIAAIGYAVVAWVLERMKRAQAPGKQMDTPLPRPDSDVWTGRSPADVAQSPGDGASAPGTPERRSASVAVPRCMNPECGQILVGQPRYCPRCGWPIPRG